ncbi:MAG: putative methyl-accepting chemotaxis receptor/sensory transducer, partial [Tardiphaga sp.]|nr:putative methyl-accepting chemotaxis receptor/sensory transducer [Tardiphaga sp.]
MALVNFRIGTKLGLTAGVGVLLVAGMLINQMQSNQSIAQSSRLVVVNTSNKANAQTAEAAIARAQLASLEVSIALTPERLNQSHETMRASLAEASVEIDAAEQRATRQQVKDLYREIKKFIEVLQAAGNDLAAARKADLAGIQVRNQTSEAWIKTFDPLLALPSLAASSNHFNIDLNLREAGGALNAARAASWRYATTAEHAQRDLILSNSDLVIAALTRARLLASEKDVVAGIDGLLVIADRFKVVSRDSVKAEETNMRVLNESVIPAGKEVSARIVKVVAIANEFSAR